MHHLVKPAKNAYMINSILYSFLNCRKLFSAKYQQPFHKNKALKHAVLKTTPFYFAYLCILNLIKIRKLINVHFSKTLYGRKT